MKGLFTCHALTFVSKSIQESAFGNNSFLGITQELDILFPKVVTRHLGREEKRTSLCDIFAEYCPRL